jgi:hypothetical protein
VTLGLIQASLLCLPLQHKQQQHSSCWQGMLLAVLQLLLHCSLQAAST